MNVINEMLRGLNKKMIHKNHDDVSHGLFAVLEKKHGIVSKWKYGLLFLIIYAAIMTSGIYYYQHGNLKNKMLTQQADVAVLKSLPPIRLLETKSVMILAKAQIPSLMNQANVQEAFAYIASIAHSPALKNKLLEPLHHSMMEIANATTDTNDEAMLRYRQAMELMEGGSAEAGILQLRLVLNRYPEHRPSRLALGDALLKQQRFAEAETTFNRGKTYLNGDVLFTQLYAQSLTGQGKLNEALAVLQSAHPNLHAQPDYYAMMAALYEQLGQYKQAIALYQSVLQVDPDNSVWWMGLGVSLDANNQNAEALQAYAHAEAANDLQPVLKSYADARMNQLEG